VKQSNEFDNKEIASSFLLAMTLNYDTWDTLFSFYKQKFIIMYSTQPSTNVKMNDDNWQKILNVNLAVLVSTIQLMANLHAENQEILTIISIRF
jgi:hypothetical protein